MVTQQVVLAMLQETSRTFFIPISRLPAGLHEAIASAYLCMRAIDEIEDHPTLDGKSKVHYLRTISQLFQAQTSIENFAHLDFSQALHTQQHSLPEVTRRIGDWASYAPASIAPRIWDTTAAMAERMADWVIDGWKMHTEADLDRYTFGVAGAVGLLVCDLWAWFEGSQLDRTYAIHFGRGLQAVNILRNRTEDLARGVDFFPTEWTTERMRNYAHYHLTQAGTYAETLPSNAFVYLIKIPLLLAHATLNALANGTSKLSRSTVLQLIQHMTDE